MSDDADTIRVPKARLREVKAEIDHLQQELAALREEHENLRAHLKGSIREVARLTEENERLRRLRASTARPGASRPRRSGAG